MFIFILARTPKRFAISRSTCVSTFNYRLVTRWRRYMEADMLTKQSATSWQKNTSGLFSSIEEMEGKQLRSFVKRMDKLSTPSAKLKCLMEFLKSKCMSQVNSAISAPVLRGDECNVTARTKNPAVATAANAYLACSSHAKLGKVLKAVRDCPQITLYASDLFERLTDVVSNASTSQEASMHPASISFKWRFDTEEDECEADESSPRHCS